MQSCFYQSMQEITSISQKKKNPKAHKKQQKKKVWEARERNKPQ